jgi:hypothetical protein
MEKIKINETDVILDDLGEGKGKVIISGYNNSYSYYWGSMGDDLKTFIYRINADYFASNLLGRKGCYSFDARKTFTGLRKFIREELDLPFYKHMEFQKEMRETLKDFERECDERGQEYFVDNFHSSFINRLNFYSIDDRWERDYIEKDFKSICEVWNFIQTQNSHEYLFLTNLHKKLKKIIKPKKSNAIITQ